MLVDVGRGVMFLCCEVVVCGDGGGLIGLCGVCIGVLYWGKIILRRLRFYKSPENRRGQNIIKAHNVYYVYFTI